MTSRRARALLLALLAVAVTGAGACSSDDGDGVAAGLLPGVGGTAPPTSAPARSGSSADGGSRELRVTAVSTRPEYVTGGDVLVEVAGVPDGSDPVVVVGGERRRGVLEPSSGDRWRGLVDGLPEGDSTVVVTAAGRRGQLDVVNHPVAGPLFSGPHQEPYGCTTELLGLGAPLDADCSLPTTVRWDWFDTDGVPHPLEDRSVVPDGVATTRVDGREVPVIVRTEVSTVNRGVTWVSALDPDPTADRWTPSGDHWNGELVYRFGGGCGTSYSQGSPMVSLGAPTVDLGLLERGYLVATNTLNTFEVHCNDVLSAETALMVKEQVAERWAVPRHTIGEGGSGGAIQQFLITQDYPGILDAVAAGAPFPDAMSIAPGVADCGLLLDYYSSPRGSSLNEDQRRAVNGHASTGTCATWQGTFLGVLDPTQGCDLPTEAVYDPVTNPDGARCTLQDSNVNVFGRDPRTGFARRPLDNTGVQYGLEALRSGELTVDEFLDLNDGIGGYDIDGNIVPGRMEADAADLRHLSSTGRVVVGAGDGLRVPMVVLNSFSDPTGDIHDRWRAFALRERLARRLSGGPDAVAVDSGVEGPRPLEDTPNLVIWTTGDGSIVESLSGGRTDIRDASLEALSEWLDNLDRRGRPASDASDGEWAEALEAARPAAAVDRCVLYGGEVLEGNDVYVTDNACTRAYPLAGDPRQVAGQDLAAVTAKCRLVPVDPSSYGTTFTPEQASRLRAVFPDGVCDWSRRGVGEDLTPTPWVSY